jgi:polysaccharide biosynthesis/export protein
MKFLSFVLYTDNRSVHASPFANSSGLCIHLLHLAIFLHLTSCSPPVYQNTTYDIEEFASDSQQIAQGKFAILALQEQPDDCIAGHQEYDNDGMMDGDQLAITLYCPRRPDRVHAFETINKRAGFIVCDGMICLPHLTPIEVGGLTLNEVKMRIQAVYREQLPDAQIYVNFKQRRARIVQIIGAGESAVVLDEQMRLSEVLAKANIPRTANLFKSYVMRNGVQLPLDLYQLIHEGDESQNIIMRGGDQIFIANVTDANIMVTGEMRHPLVIPVPYGFLPLREALAVAGGIPFTGDKNCIQVIRGDLTRPKIYILSWEEMIRYPNQSLLLMPGDVVVISDRPITQWNRLIDQLQPSAASMQTSFNIYGIYRAVR